MISEKKPKLKQKKFRHIEYYNMTEIFDKLYAQSKGNSIFTNLMDIITSEENIKLAYRNIKRNKGSQTAGVDGITIGDLENISEIEFVIKIQNKLAWYKSKPVKRVDIPKPNGKTRPLGIPAMWDRLVQQCILQVLEPICEAKFHERSNGFRPNRSVEHAMAQCYNMIQIRNLHFVVDIDIKGFFDNVNHTKLKQQMWNMGIRDKKLLCVINEMLKAPIIMPDGSKVIPQKGTPQGGVLSPLLSNIVLNELDWWINSQWEGFPTKKEYFSKELKSGTIDRTGAYRALRNTKLKEVFIVRYADDFKIFCRTRDDANRIFHATEQWLKDRLNLEVNKDKSKVINLKKSYSEFLGFKMKAVPKRNKHVVKSNMCDKAKESVTKQLIKRVKDLQKPQNANDEYLMLTRYNALVWGVHNYYRIATHINKDCTIIGRQIDIVMKNRIRGRLSRKGDPLTPYIKKQYGKSKQLRFINGNAVCPIAFVQKKDPMFKKAKVCKYTVEGRQEIHKTLGVNMTILHQLMQTKEVNRSIEYTDNRISLYAAQLGRCAITGEVLEFNDIHCHHKLPVKLGGTDKYQNLIIVHKDVHKLIHAKLPETITKYIDKIMPNNTMLKHINKLRKQAKLEMLAII